MTKDEAVAKLMSDKALLEGGDNETAHSNADEVLVEFLKANGFAEVAAAWEDASERIGFWYA